MRRGRVDLSKRRRRIDCDAVLMSVGWAAAANLLLQAGGIMRICSRTAAIRPAGAAAGQFAAGRVNGVYDFEPRVADGKRAGAASGAHAGFGDAARDARSLARRAPPVASLSRSSIIPRGKNFVDFDEDLQVKDLENAAQEGFDSSELLKRYSTVGMGPSQGKHSNMNALRILARYRGHERRVSWD